MERGAHINVFAVPRVVLWHNLLPHLSPRDVAALTCSCREGLRYFSDDMWMSYWRNSALAPQFEDDPRWSQLLVPIPARATWSTVCQVLYDPERRAEVAQKTLVHLDVFVASADAKPRAVHFKFQFDKSLDTLWREAVGPSQWMYGGFALLWNTPGAGEPPTYNGGALVHVDVRKVMLLTSARMSRRPGQEIFAIPQQYCGFELCVHCLRLFNPASNSDTACEYWKNSSFRFAREDEISADGSLYFVHLNSGETATRRHFSAARSEKELQAELDALRSAGHSWTVPAVENLEASWANMVEARDSALAPRKNAVAARVVDEWAPQLTRHALVPMTVAEMRDELPKYETLTEHCEILFAKRNQSTKAWQDFYDIRGGRASSEALALTDTDWLLRQRHPSSAYNLAELMTVESSCAELRRDDLTRINPGVYVDDKGLPLGEFMLLYVLRNWGGMYPHYVYCTYVVRVRLKETSHFRRRPTFHLFMESVKSEQLTPYFGGARAVIARFGAFGDELERNEL